MTGAMGVLALAHYSPLQEWAVAVQSERFTAVVGGRQAAFTVGR